MGTIVTGIDYASVPSMALSTQTFVEHLLNDSRTAAQELVNDARAAITELKAPLDQPHFPNPPTVVSPLTTVEGGGALTATVVGVPNLGQIYETINQGETFEPDHITIPDISGSIPLYTQLVTGFNMPAVPAAGSFTFPNVPALDLDLTVPAAPTPDYGLLPDLYTLTLPTYVAPVLAPFAHSAPTFDAVLNDDGIDWTEPTYTGHLATTLTATLQLLLAGGTGIDPVVENAIWERDRSRVLKQSAADRAKVADEWARKGFTLPLGAILAAQADIDMDAVNKIAQASRDVAIKQADLEQSNRQFAVKTGLELEQLYVQIFLAAAQRSFDIAKLAVDVRIQIFNALISKYNTDAKVFEVQMAQYRIELEYALAQIQSFKALVEAENVKADVNKSLIESYKAKIQAYQAQADAYGALVKAVVARSDLQKNKVDVYRAQIDGVVAQIGAKKQEFDAYSAQVSAEAKKADLEDANSRAYTARVSAIGAVAGITLKQAEVGIQNSQMKLQYKLGQLTQMGAIASEQLRAIQINASLYEANTRLATANVESGIKAKELQITSVIELNKAQIANYTAQLEQWRAQVVTIQANVQLQSEAMKTAAQIAGTMAAGAYAGTSVSAAFGGSVNRGETTSASKSTSDSTSTSISSINSFSQSTNTNFNHNIAE
jgi:hypothetical protein